MCAAGKRQGSPLGLGVLVFELEGDLIRRSADYYDFAAVLGQLGQLGTDEAATEATPAP